VEEVRGQNPASSEEALGVPMGVAAEESEGGPDRGDRRVGAAAAEELLAAGALGADAARRRQVAPLEQRVADAPQKGEVLYATAEESAAQVRMRAERLGIREETLP
jgi:hypothetical protein